MTAFAWMREKLAALPRRAPKTERVTGFDRTPFAVRNAVNAATLGALAFMILWCLEFVGQIHLDLRFNFEDGLPHLLDYKFEGDLSVLPLLALLCVSFGIILWNKAWVTLFASTPWADWFTKWGALTVGLLGSAVLILGSLDVNQETRVDDRRGALQIEQQAAQDRAALVAQRNSIRTRLTEMRNHENQYMAVAATVGAAEFERNYLSPEMLRTETAERRRLLQRSLGAARQADALEAQALELEGQIAAAPTEAAVAATVAMTDPVSQFMNTLGQWRIVVFALTMDLVLLFGPYFANKYEENRRREQAFAEPREFDAAHAIPDLREEAPVAPEPMRPAKRRARDGETGDPLTFVEGHWRRTTEPKRAKPRMRKDKDGVEVEAPAGVIRLNGDEIGLAAAAAGVVMAPSVAAVEVVKAPESPSSEEAYDHGDEHAPDSTTLTLDEETLNAIAALNADTAEDPDPAHTLPNNEGVLVDEDEVYGPPAPVRRDVMEDA